MRLPAAALLIAAIVPRSLAGADDPGEAPGRPLPTVAALIVEQGVDDGTPVAWWNHGRSSRARKPSRGTGRSAETALVSEWQPSGFRFAPLDPVAGQLAAERIGAGDLTPAQARAAGRICGSGLVVHGTAVASTEDNASGALERAAGTRGFKPLARRTCVATVAVRAYRAETGEVVGEAESTARSSEPHSAVCGRSAIEKAAREAAAELRDRILAMWRDQRRTSP